MSIILSIESGTDICSVAVARDGVVVGLRETAEGRDHARLVASYCDELLRDNAISPKELSAVAVSEGPGSYTGLRIGVSFAKGLCYGLQVPLIGVSSLQSLVEMARERWQRGEIDIEAECWESAIIAPMVDARRMEVYTQLFDTKGVAMGDIEAKVVDESSFAEQREAGQKLVLIGNGAAKCNEVLPWTQYIEVGASATGVAKIAHEKLLRGEVEDVAYFEPFYLKDVVITKSNKRYF